MIFFALTDVIHFSHVAQHPLNSMQICVGVLEHVDILRRAKVRECEGVRACGMVCWLASLGMFENMQRATC